MTQLDDPIIGKDQKLDALRIELQRRRDTYPPLVASGAMTIMEADRGVMIVEAMISDYTHLASDEGDTPSMAVVRELAACSESLPMPPEQIERLAVIVGLAKEVLRASPS